MALLYVYFYSLILDSILYFTGALSLPSEISSYFLYALPFFNIAIQILFLLVFIGITHITPLGFKLFSKNVWIFVATLSAWAYFSQLALTKYLAISDIALELNLFWQLLVGMVSVVQFILALKKNLIPKTTN